MNKMNKIIIKILNLAPERLHANNDDIDAKIGNIE
tara:strand:+ start:435 stop:539 length:105 start_codon:yes stop_codon:yes gene_type:complete